MKIHKIPVDMHALIFTVLFLFFLLVIYNQLAVLYLVNVGLNSLIIAACLIGLLSNFTQILAFRKSVRWISSFAEGRDTASPRKAPSLITGLVSFLEQQTNFVFPETETSVMLSVRTHLDELRDRRMTVVGLLLVLGALGTAWGVALGLTDLSASLGSADQAGLEEILVLNLSDSLGQIGSAFAPLVFASLGAFLLLYIHAITRRAESVFIFDLEKWLTTLSYKQRQSGE